MFFSFCLYVALGIFGIGLIYKVTRWFRYQIGDSARNTSTSQRIAAAVKGSIRCVFSVKFFSLLKVFVLDVILQRKVLKESVSRWFMHMCIYVGFTLLLLSHALEEQIVQPLFSDYASTLNPFLFLRNVFGVLMFLGVALAVYRRLTVKGMRLTTRAMDRYATSILAVIAITGILLEATKTVSYTAFDEMVEEYSALGGEEEIKPLKAYWEKEFGVVFPEAIGPADEAMLKEGMEIHENECSACHSRPQWAFASYGVARAIKPMAIGLMGAGVDKVLWYMHFLACFIGLAYLPFSKFFHVLASPVSLLANEVMDKKGAEPAAAATRRSMELDACTHCATCSIHCSVGVVFQRISNANILPSEKLCSLKLLASGKKLGAEDLRKIQEGSHICTSCYRCTNVCPVGINLQDLWFAIREDLAKQGYPEPFVWARDAVVGEHLQKIQEASLPLLPKRNGFQDSDSLSARAATFSRCFECQTCTQVCPVVGNYDNPGEVLGLLPHQIMHSLGLGLRDYTLSSRMIWDCVTCYLCQEHCPQGVQVTDVLYELKNMGYKHARAAG
jgi:heterodisulfide reductase subunit C/nitrate reductase gamma subunit